MKFEAANLSCGYGRNIIVQNVSFSMEEGETVCLLGPNGVGKTTFFRTLLGFIKPLKGKITIDGHDVTQMKPSHLATQIAYVPQSGQVPFPFSVEDVVLMGRNVHTMAMSGPSSHDRQKVRHCMASLDISHLAHKVYSRLSGGERQMVLIARALTQEAPFMVLDEPTSNLDFGNQIRIMKLIRELKDRGIGIVMTTHSPDQALLCGTRVIVFQSGTLVQTGRPETVITSSLLRKVYGVDVRIQEVPIDAACPTRVCVPCLGHPSEKLFPPKEAAVREIAV